MQRAAISIVVLFFVFLLPANAQPVDTAKAIACARNLEQFIRALDAVLTENPKSITRYQDVLAKYLLNRSATRSLPPPAPGAAIEGCQISDVMRIAGQSKFLHEASGPPRYEHYVIEFRNADVKVGFEVAKETGNIIGSDAMWIATSL